MGIIWRFNTRRYTLVCTCFLLLLAISYRVYMVNLVLCNNCVERSAARCGRKCVAYEERKAGQIFRSESGQAVGRTRGGAEVCIEIGRIAKEIQC